MQLSVIIPTRNRSSLLSVALESLMTQDLASDQFEIIVIDNGSTDDTAARCKAFSQRTTSFTYRYEQAPGLHIARHLGMRLAKGDVLVYADDDIQARSSWLVSIRASFQNQRVGLVGGKIEPDYESEPPAWVLSMWRRTRHGTMLPQYSVLDFGDAVIEVESDFVWGCNFSIRKPLVERAGGFHPDSFPEDHIVYRGDGEIGLARKVQSMGYICLYNPDAAVRHRVSDQRMTLDYVRKRGFSQGISDSYTLTRHKRLPLNTVEQHGLMMKHHLQQRLRQILYQPGIGFKRYCQGYRAGFRFHQRSLVAVPDLLDWVLKESYLDS